MIAPTTLRIDEAARYIGISRGGIYNLVRAGELKPLKLGRTTLIRRRDIDALLDRRAGQVSDTTADVFG